MPPNTRAPRVTEVRRLNTIESAPDHAIAVAGSAAADTTDEAGAAYGTPLLCDGYERLNLHLAFIAGGGDISDVRIVAQASPHKPGEVTQWFDVYADPNNDLTLTREVWIAALTVDSRIVFNDMKRRSRWMRFKVFTTASDRSDSRAVVTAIRTMDAA